MLKQVDIVRRTAGGNAVTDTSAVRYSRIAALYTAAVAPTLPWLVVLDFRCLWIRPTGNCGENRKTKRASERGNKGLSGPSVRGGHQRSNLWASYSC